MFVFVFMQDIIVGANAGADGCDSRTRPAWLSEHSQGGVGVEGLQVVFVGRWPYTLVVFFCKGICLCASAVHQESALRLQDVLGLPKVC